MPAILAELNVTNMPLKYTENVQVVTAMATSKDTSFQTFYILIYSF